MTSPLKSLMIRFGCLHLSVVWLSCCHVPEKTPVLHETWPIHIIDSAHSGADGVKLYDVNKDGREDLVTGWEESGITKLYYHPGNEGLKLPWPSELLGETPSVEDAVCCDLDGDGLVEVIASCEGDERNIFIFSNSNDGNWQSQILPAGANRMRWMYAKCLQVDGENGMDIIAGGKGEGAALGWFAAPAVNEDWEAWQWHTITDVGWTMSILTADLNLDGRQDVIVTDRKGEHQGCRWLEHPGSLVDQILEWKSHTVGAEGLEVMFMDAIDLDGDEYPELVVSERTSQTVRIYTCSAKDGLEWHEKVIDLPDNIVHAKAVHCADVNNDQIIDFLVSSNTEGEKHHGLVWIDGTSIGSDSPQFYPVASRHSAKFDDLKTVDIDQDGDLDILTCEENFGKESEGLGLIWYENILADRR